MRAHRWFAANTRPVRDLADSAVLRPALDALALRLDGKPAAASTVSRKRAIFYNSVEYAVELGHLPGNPIASIKWRAPKITEAVNPRVVINYAQVRALPAAVDPEPSGPALVAFFAVMYYAALRPGAAVDPYDLQHAADSTWLNSGVPAPQVAAWAGHSVDVLLRVCAKCVVGQEGASRRRIEEASRDGCS